MKVTILGSGNAWGPNPFITPAPILPMAGTLSDGRRVEIRKYRTSLLIEACSGERILVDCSPDFGHQLREYNIGALDALLITHPHLDHIGGMDELNLYRYTDSLPIPTYATKKCWDCIENERGLKYVQDIGLVQKNELKLGREDRAFCIGSVQVTPLAVQHHFIAPGSVGYLFEESDGGGLKRVLYSGDFWAFNDPNDEAFGRELDVAILECDRWGGLTGEAVGGGHMSFVEAIRMMKDGALSRPRPKQVVFVHFGDRGPEGAGSSYTDWRTCALGELNRNDLEDVIADEDHVIGYEGLTLG